jgi:hypothetical protein
METRTRKLRSPDVRRLGPGIHPDGEGLYLQVSSGRGRSWLYRYSLRGKEHRIGLGSAAAISLKEARALALEARRLCVQGIDPLKRDRSLKRAAGPLGANEWAAEKFADFLKSEIRPAAYLYRHFDPKGGDLIYVGITISPLNRAGAHIDAAKWRDQICTIVIEPFASEEEAIQAEEVAIRTEFPKYNQIHEGE